VQTCATKAFQVVLALGVLLYGHLAFDSGQRNIGLHTAKVLQRRLGDIFLLGHACSGRKAPTKSPRLRMPSRARRIASS
jgi:hypothetical protein